ncbi:hypothetical protein [Streptomyces sp. NPDC005799]|uniref:hypothetical protein n=1 Tax=Streptomyces sp. NPDC005799 TaxID=3154678 RepID=UPI0033F595B6
MAAEPQKTGIKNADEIITLAAAYGLTVTVETTDRETITSYVVRLAIPVPVAYAGTELGRAIASDTLVMLWTKPNKGGRGRLENATAWGTVSHRKVRTLRHVTAAVERMGHDSNKYARDTAPLPEDVVDALHAVFVDGRKVHPGILAAHVRKIVSNRRFRGHLVHQDDDKAICIEDRRYAPVIVTGPTADDVVDAPHAVIDSHNDRHKDIPADDVRHMITLRREAGQSSHQSDDGTITAAGIRFIPQPAAEERKHVRIANGGTPEIIPTRDALDEMNTAQMEGKRDVREMSAARSSARIVYKDDRGTVVLRPATQEDLAAAADRIRTAAAKTARAEMDRLEAQKLATNQVIEERARAVLETGGHTVGVLFRTNHNAVCLYAVDENGNERTGDTLDTFFDAYTETLEAQDWFVEYGKTGYHGSHLVLLPPAGDAEDVVREGARRREAAEAPLFVALAAYESATHAALSSAPRDLEDLAHHLLALGKVAPTAQHLEIVEAQGDVEEAWEALRAARGLTARNAAFDKARTAVERARAVILAVAPHAHRMHGTDVPATAEEIRAAARAYNAVGSTPEELSAVETGTPQVRVHCASDNGTGWKVTATITAGVDTPLGFIPAHPPLAETFRKRDGREDATVNARRVIGALFRVAVPVEYALDRRV